jgi:uncharacterized protein (UPF0333 family)
MEMGKKPNKKVILKKASAFAEYAILIFIIVAVIGGVHYFMKRAIQSHVKDLTDKYIRSGGGAAHAGLEWGSSTTFSSSSSTLTKNEEFGGNMTITSQSNISQTTLQAPVPSIRGWSAMEHKGSALHVQDAPSAAVTPDYPDLEYKKWDDKDWLVSS